MQPGDRAEIHALLTRLTVYEAQFEADRDPDPSRNAEYFDAVAEDIARQGGFILVAEAEGRPAGYLSVLFDDYGAYLKEDLRRHAHITDMFVAERHRGEGIGAMLVAEAERRACAAGLKRMTVGALTRNALANTAYRSFGFRSYAILYIKELD